jgi:hypothetical protein
LLVLLLLLPSNAWAEVRRGLFLEVDVGAGVTIGGRNTNVIGDANPGLGVCRVAAGERPPFPRKIVSNVQPFGAVIAGYDLYTSRIFSLSGGLRLAFGHANGAARVDEAELESLYDDPSCLETIGTQSADHAVYLGGAVLEAAFMLSDRFELSLEASGSLAVVDPDPVLSAGEPRAGDATFGPAIGGALAVRYFTLLDGFSVGLDLRFEMILLSGASIPGVQVAIPIRYTF